MAEWRIALDGAVFRMDDPSRCPRCESYRYPCRCGQMREPFLAPSEIRKVIVALEAALAKMEGSSGE